MKAVFVVVFSQEAAAEAEDIILIWLQQKANEGAAKQAGRQAVGRAVKAEWGESKPAS